MLHALSIIDIHMELTPKSLSYNYWMLIIKYPLLYKSHLEFFGSMKHYSLVWFSVTSGLQVRSMSTSKLLTPNTGVDCNS